MRPMRVVIVGLMVPGVAWCARLRSQEAKSEEGAEPTAAVVRPARVEVLSLQVSKLPRDQFGHGIKPGTFENVGAWLVGSGTAVALRIELDRPVGRFQEHASRIVRFLDDKERDVSPPPDGREINTLFADNKPIVVKPGPGAGEAEVILRGYGTPFPGATRLQVHADLVFLSATGERVAVRKGLEPTPGTRAAIGPLRIVFQDPAKVPAPPRGLPGFGPFGRPRPEPDVRAGQMRVAFDYERLEAPIKSLSCLDPQGVPLITLEGRTFEGPRGGTVTLAIPEMPRITLRVVSYEKTEAITVPIRPETGVGF